MPLSLILLGLFLPSRCVRHNDMSRSIQPNDIVWIWKTEIQRGDVLLLRNPLDPTENILRRFIAGAGETVLYDRNGTVRIDGTGIRQRDMGNGATQRIIEETIWRGDHKIQWRIERLLKPIRLRFDPILVPKDHLLVLFGLPELGIIHSIHIQMHSCF